MAHNIGKSRGRDMIFTAGERAWHQGLAIGGTVGVNVSENVTGKDAIIHAALNWTVSTEDAYTVTADGLQLLPGVRAIRRDDTGEILGSTGDVWTPVQNVDAFGFMDSIVGDQLAMFHTAGALGNGSKVWISAEIPGEMRIRKAPKDVSKGYLLLTNSHKGNESLRAWFTSVRVVCQNTLMAAEGARGRSEGIRIRHTKNATTAIDDARKALGLAVKTFEQTDEIQNRLAETPISIPAFRDYVETLVPDNDEAKSNSRTQNIRAAIAENFRSIEFPEIRDTYWAAVNAVTKYADHQKSVRGTSDAERASNRLESAWFGTGADLKADAWDLALERAEIVLPALASN